MPRPKKEKTSRYYASRYEDIKRENPAYVAEVRAQNLNIKQVVEDYDAKTGFDKSEFQYFYEKETARQASLPPTVGPLPPTVGPTVPTAPPMEAERFINPLTGQYFSERDRTLAQFLDEARIERIKKGELSVGGKMVKAYTPDILFLKIDEWVELKRALTVEYARMATEIGTGYLMPLEKLLMKLKEVEDAGITGLQEVKQLALTILEKGQEKVRL